MWLEVEQVLFQVCWKQQQKFCFLTKSFPLFWGKVYLFPSIKFKWTSEWNITYLENFKMEKIYKNIKLKIIFKKLSLKNTSSRVKKPQDM